MKNALFSLRLLLFDFFTGFSHTMDLKRDHPCVVYIVKIWEASSSGVKVDCSGKNLMSIPKKLPKEAEIIDLHGNEITDIEGNIFMKYTNLIHLDLSNNQLKKLERHSFTGLFNLQVLNIAGNFLCLPNSYPHGVFKDLKSLRHLKTYSNRCPTKHTKIPDDVFKDLCALKKISLNVVENFTFGSEFEGLTSLQHVEVSCHEDCDSYKIYIKNNSFIGLNRSKITQLTLRGMAYKDIESSAFDVLPHLSTLNTACASSLKIRSLLEAIHSMKTTTLETLILDGMRALGPFSKLQFPFCHSKFQKLKRLSVRGNLIFFSGLKLQYNGRSCLPNLSHINIGINTIASLVSYTGTDYGQGQYILTHGFPATYFWSLSNIRTVDASHLFDQGFSLDFAFCKAIEQDAEEYFRPVPKIIADVPDLDDFNVTSGYIRSKDSENRTNIPSFKGVVHTLLVSPGTQVFFADSVTPGQVIDPSVSGQCPFVIYPFDTIAYFNISHNAINMLRCPLIGVRSLRVLDASYCQITSFHDQFECNNLELFYLKGNKLNNTNAFEKIFKSTSLKELDLSSNSITTLPNKSFVNLMSLEKMDLSDNLLTEVNIKFSQTGKLRILDLSSNLLQNLKQPFLTHLELLSKQNPRFKVRLYGNPIACSCDSTYFLNWLKRTNVFIERLNEMKCINSTVLLTNVNTIKLSKSCDFSVFRYYVVIGSLTSFILVIITISLTAYKQRWKIAWHLYTLKRRLNGNKYEILSTTDDDRVYDAYVAYYRDDDLGLPWLKNELIEWVEEDWGKKLFIFDRDSIAGNSIIGETIAGIQRSKKVLFVLTDAYLKHGQWDMVLYWAVRQGLNNIIMCCLGETNLNALPKTLARVASDLQENYPTHYMEFRNDCFAKNQNAMWESLNHALKDISTNEETKIFKRQKTYTVRDD